MALVCADSVDPLVQVGDLAPLDVGNDSSVSLVVYNENVVVAVVASNSFCWNSEFHNKDPAVGLCDQTPQSTPLILSYAYGTIEAFSSHILSQQPLTV